MRVEAYQCDHCKELKLSSDCVGISAQPDLFCAMDGFPIVYNPSKADIHLCVSCYNKHAVEPAERAVNRRKDEEGYKNKLKEFSYSTRAQCVHNYNAMRIQEKGKKNVAHVKQK